MPYRERYDIDKNPHGVIGKNSDVRGGVGPIELLVSIDEYLKSPNTFLSVSDTTEHGLVDARTACQVADTHGRPASDSGLLCNRCGYDRAKVSSHTEVDYREMRCMNCDNQLAIAGEDA